MIRIENIKDDRKSRNLGQQCLHFLCCMIREFFFLGQVRLSKVRRAPQVYPAFGIVFAWLEHSIWSRNLFIKR